MGWTGQLRLFTFTFLLGSRVTSAQYWLIYSQIAAAVLFVCRQKGSKPLKSWKQSIFAQPSVLCINTERICGGLRNANLRTSYVCERGCVPPLDWPHKARQTAAISWTCCHCANIQRVYILLYICVTAAWCYVIKLRFDTPTPSKIRITVV